MRASTMGQHETGSDRTVPSAMALLDDVLTRIWWMPVAFVVAVLLILLCVPLFVNNRVAALRRDSLDVADQARVLVNDLEAAYVAQLYAHDARAAAAATSADSVGAASLAEQQKDERGLDSLVRTIGQPAVRDLELLIARSHQWHRLLMSRDGTTAQIAGDATVTQLGLDLLAAAEALDHDLLRVSTRARDKARYYARMELVATAVLTPLALLAMCMVVWTGWRILTMAHAIERERLALARSIHARTALIHGVTHDVKNPLGAAIGYAQLLEDGVLGAMTGEQSGAVQRIRHLVDVALQTIAELLDVARADSGKLPVAMTETNVRSLITELVDDYGATAREKQITLRVAQDESALVVSTDAVRVRRIVGNLLSNAIKYTPSGGNVSVSAQVANEANANHDHALARKRHLLIAVRDDGPGVPPEIRDRIFDEFYRSPAVEQNTAGNGMGLAISRRFANALGGDIDVAGATAEGATFTLRLPVPSTAH
ncbi:MAG: HAMP domain-containing sensor histidine kinase [bacterium]